MVGLLGWEGKGREGREVDGWLVGKPTNQPTNQQTNNSLNHASQPVKLRAGLLANHAFQWLSLTICANAVWSC